MRTVRYESQFKKDLKRVLKRGENAQTLSALIDYIAAHGTAPAQCKPHKLHGAWSPALECHVDNSDWLLVYVVSAHLVTVHRTGSHSDLFE